MKRKSLSFSDHVFIYCTLNPLSRYIKANAHCYFTPLSLCTIKLMTHLADHCATASVPQTNNWLDWKTFPRKLWKQNLWKLKQLFVELPQVKWLKINFMEFSEKHIFAEGSLPTTTQIIFVRLRQRKKKWSMLKLLHRDIIKLLLDWNSPSRWHFPVFLQRGKLST